MRMAYSFGGNTFGNCWIPIVFHDRCFLLEPGTDGLLVSVVMEMQGNPAFEVLRNELGPSPAMTVTETAAGIITISDPATGKFLYKIRPESETSIVFGTLSGGEIEARITDRYIQIGNRVLSGNVIAGFEVGVIVGQDGNLGIAGSLPPGVRRWLVAA